MRRGTIYTTESLPRAEPCSFSPTSSLALKQTCTLSVEGGFLPRRLLRSSCWQALSRQSLLSPAMSWCKHSRASHWMPAAMFFFMSRYALEKQVHFLHWMHFPPALLWRPIRWFIRWITLAPCTLNRGNVTPRGRKLVLGYVLYKAQTHI